MSKPVRPSIGRMPRVGGALACRRLARILESPPACFQIWMDLAGSTVWPLHHRLGPWSDWGGRTVECAERPATYHGHLPAEDRRLSLQLNWMVDAASRDSELKRHRRSALLKRINPFG